MSEHRETSCDVQAGVLAARKDASVSQAKPAQRVQFVSLQVAYDAWYYSCLRRTFKLYHRCHRVPCISPLWEIRLHLQADISRLHGELQSEARHFSCCRGVCFWSHRVILRKSQTEVGWLAKTFLMPCRTHAASNPCSGGDAAGGDPTSPHRAAGGVAQKMVKRTLASLWRECVS